MAIEKQTIIVVTYEGSIAEHKGEIVKHVAPTGFTHVDGSPMAAIKLANGYEGFCRLSSLCAVTMGPMSDLDERYYNG